MIENLKSNGNITIFQEQTVITVTKKTVRFGKDVYQTHNITGFSEGEIEIGSIPWIVVILLFIGGSAVVSFNETVGWLVTLAGIAGGVWNFIKPKHYGLLITLNSGDKKLFVTPDTQALKQVIMEIYEFIEQEQENDAAYQITITNSKVSGNFILGNVGGDALYR